MVELCIIPLEVLELVAFHTASTSFLGPPSSLLPLVSLTRRTYRELSFSSNPHLWARVFVQKFDLVPSDRTGFGSRTNIALARATELKKRTILLKRLRARSDVFVPAFALDDDDDNDNDSEGSVVIVNDNDVDTRDKFDNLLSPTQEEYLREELWMVYLMMLENGGKNERQLREYAGIDRWLKDYLFDPCGASLARMSIKHDVWPPDNERVSLAIWLFWFLFRPGKLVLVLCFSGTL